MIQPLDNCSPRFPVSVKGVLLRDGHVVLVGNSRGEWELPGGKLEPGETPEDCVAREIAEELDVRVSVGPLLDAWVYHIADGVDVLVLAYGCAATDLPIHGLLTDLKRRGLFDSTLVVWGGEFGRMPVSQGGNGRDHNPRGFLVWMAGAGIKGGASHGETDEIGYRAAVDPVTVHDLHATMLHLLGIDHKRLTFLHNGRRYRLTDVAGNVLTRILA